MLVAATEFMPPPTPCHSRPRERGRRRGTTRRRRTMSSRRVSRSTNSRSFPPPPPGRSFPSPRHVLRITGDMRFREREMGEDSSEMSIYVPKFRMFFSSCAINGPHWLTDHSHIHGWCE
ncbi:hypothetical protein ZWY2020_034611 [Hordeum vulgare]|nr:hypothetical protein ZWY2020_034611 [Hordeum vulgare]